MCEGCVYKGNECVKDVYKGNECVKDVFIKKMNV